MPRNVAQAFDAGAEAQLVEQREKLAVAAVFRGGSALTARRHQRPSRRIR